MAASAHIILDKLLAQTKASTLLELSLMRDGVLEWAQRQDGKWVGLGQPRIEFFATLIDPLSKEYEPLRTRKRLKYFGIRLIERIK